LNDFLALFPAESVTQQSILVVPIANSEPEDFVHVGFSSPSTSSIAVTTKLTCTPRDVVASVTISRGTIKNGALLSLMGTGIGSNFGTGTGSICAIISPSGVLSQISPIPSRSLSD